MGRHRLIILGCAAVLALILPVVHYLSHNDVAHQAIRIWLEHFGSSIYEYHSITGKWPSQTADLAENLRCRNSSGIGNKYWMTRPPSSSGTRT